MAKKRRKEKGCIHIEYTHVYHNILKYEEVQDIELETIYQVFRKVISDYGNNNLLSTRPTNKVISKLIDKVLDELGV